MALEIRSKFEFVEIFEGCTDAVLDVVEQNSTGWCGWDGVVRH